MVAHFDDLSNESDSPASCEAVKMEISGNQREMEWRNAYDSQRVACCSLGAWGDPFHTRKNASEGGKSLCVFPFDRFASRMSALRRHPRSFHASLIALRLLAALTAQSIIHPDEHFQNSEIASTIFDYANTGTGPLRTWEWTGEAPCRSIVPVWATTGAGFAVLKFVAGDR